VAGVVALVSVGLNAQDSMSASSKLTAADNKFVVTAAEGGMAEVEMGKLAAEKGNSDDVKKFGQRMVDDHSKANDKLKELAGQKGVTCPSDLNAKDKATKARLEKLSGDAFDRAYMKDMLVDHKKDVAEFKKESMKAKDPDVKSFATETLPTLEEHLKQAESVTPKAGMGGMAK
jgi:putative membrane protein